MSIRTWKEADNLLVMGKKKNQFDLECQKRVIMLSQFPV